MCGGGGAGGSGTQRYEWNDGLASYWTEVLGQANYLTGLGMGGGPTNQYQQYGGQRIADMNSQQNAGLGRVSDIFNQGGTAASNAAGAQAASTLGNGYLTGTGKNPYSTKNEYEGNSPQFQAMLQSGLGEITDAYKQGTSADTTRMFNLSGALGSSAHGNTIANNENALAKQLGNYANQMQNEQFNRSAGLNESYLNRGSQNYEGERGRQMGALGYGAQDLQSQLGLGNAMVGVGDAYRGFSQDQLNLGYQDWQDQQNWAMKQLENMTNIMSRAQGGVAPNSTTTNPGYSASPFSQLLGAGLLGYGAFGGK